MGFFLFLFPCMKKVLWYTDCKQTTIATDCKYIALSVEILGYEDKAREGFLQPLKKKKKLFSARNQNLSHAEPPLANSWQWDGS